MKKLLWGAVILTFLAAVCTGCGSGGTNENQPGGTSEQTGATDTGTLQFTANGEDFVRQGFTSKDGWAITFDHVYVNLADVTAYQADPPYDAHEAGEVQAKTEVNLPGTYTVDLAEGGEDVPPIVVGEVPDVPAGHYNAISWKMLKATEGPAEGYSLVVVGKAVKNGKTVDFTFKNEQEYKYTGGEYVGDERKGIVQKGGTAGLEMTFHFDHIFGDAGTPANDDLNVGAPGFEPFASLAENGVIDIDMAGLREKLSPEVYQKLVEILPTLGHVGEGHCHCEVL